MVHFTLAGEWWQFGYFYGQLLFWCFVLFSHWPKDLERPAGRCNIFPVWILPPAPNVVNTLHLVPSGGRQNQVETACETCETPMDNEAMEKEGERFQIGEMSNVKSNSDYSVQNDESLCGHSEKRCDLTWQQKIDREGAAVTCDGKLFDSWAAATGNALSPIVDRRVCRMSRDVDEAERSRHLASVSAGWHSFSRWCHIIIDPLRSLQSVKSAEQWADAVEARRREYQTLISAWS